MAKNIRDYLERSCSQLMLAGWFALVWLMLAATFYTGDDASRVINPAKTDSRIVAQVSQPADTVTLKRKQTVANPMVREVAASTENIPAGK